MSYRHKFNFPRRYGVPLSYVCRLATATPLTHYNDFIEEYVDRAPLTSQAFTTDASKVHTYIIKFTTGNTTAEAKMIPHANKNNGQLDFIALKNHYEGTGVHAVTIVQPIKL